MNRLAGQAVVAAMAITLVPLIALGEEEQAPITVATIDAWATDLSNAGRWGEYDQLGTLNLITPAVRVAAAKLVTEGVSVSMAHPLLTARSADNWMPFEHKMQATPDKAGGWATDTWSLMFHGFAHSHIDALCHLAYKGKYYNGFPMSGDDRRGVQEPGHNQHR